jgi:hypothetical protein
LELGRSGRRGTSTLRGGARKDAIAEASETPLRGTGSGYDSSAEALWSVNPTQYKSCGGEQESESARDIPAAFRPGMTAGERAEPESRLEPSLFFGLEFDPAPALLSALLSAFPGIETELTFR